jgi:hypothetical protein
MDYDMLPKIAMAVGLLVACCLLASADEPQLVSEKPPYERLLQRDDAKQALELTEKIEKAEQADQYDKAIDYSMELLALRTKIQRADHWETVNVRWALEGRRKLPQHGLQPVYAGEVRRSTRTLPKGLRHPARTVRREACRHRRELQELGADSDAANQPGGKDEDLKLPLPSADSQPPASKSAKPFAHPRFWSAFILIGDPN